MKASRGNLATPGAARGSRPGRATNRSQLGGAADSPRRLRFALLGAAGYIAPRHFQAIAETGHELLAVCDPHDSVGIIDSYFPSARYFRSLEDLAQAAEQWKKEGVGLDFVSVCTPNHLHAHHVEAALGWGAHVICEKPLALGARELDRLEALSREHGRNVYPVLQLREHPAICQLYHQVSRSGRDDYEIELTYVTSRGAWYLASWKGDEALSGGLASNIGVHFFDMLSWVFGSLRSFVVHESTDTRVRGELLLRRARVRWLLSIDRADLPASTRDSGQTTARSLTIDGQEFEFSGGFDQLHTQVYRKIISGHGYLPQDARAAVELTERLRGQVAGERITHGRRGAARHETDAGELAAARLP